MIMCLILFAYDCHPEYKLIIAANRDEFYQRPTLPASFWEDSPQILAGRDLREGGTWMGITTTRRYAALTNHRDPAANKPAAPSRGNLVSQYLAGDFTPPGFIDQLVDGGRVYNGFNLLMVYNDLLYYYSNIEKQLHKVEKGIHGLSNSLLDVPWPKVTTGIKGFTETIKNNVIDTEQLFAVMANREQPDDEELPETGLSLAMERMLAPVFVTSPNYGTRLTTIITVRRDDHVCFQERSFIRKSPDVFKEVQYEF